MGFVTPLLLGGAALVAVPIVLHLIMRRETQQIRFPALRFVQQRRSLNQHRLRLRHLLLLALRCAAIALLAFALARPTLRGSGTVGKDDAPVATALVFDNSVRMKYEYGNKSRLDEAKDLAVWLLDQLPADSPVTVVDRGGRQRGQDLDRAAAELRVERLDLSSTVRPMADALRDAEQWLDDKADHRGEIYVFTDLSAEAWPNESLAELAAWLNNSPGTNLYLIDVGVQEPRNQRLGALRPSSERVAPGGLLQLVTDLSAIGADPNRNAEQVVELYVDNGDAAAEKRDQQAVAIIDGRPAPVELALSGLGLGTHQGYVRLAASDALASDNIRYFTVDVRPPIKVLLLGEAVDDALFLREALAPSAPNGLVPPKFDCDIQQYGEIENLPLPDYAVIGLIDPPPLPDVAWKALVDFAGGGGGVGIYLGRRARRDEMNRPAAQQLLPAKLRWQSREATYLRPVAVEHPALGALRELGDAVPWSEFPVFKYWEVDAGAESVQVVASFANGRPAILERQIGPGRVLMLTTPLSDPAHADPWNLLPTGSDPWPFLALANGMADYLAGLDDSQLNYVAGQTASLPLSPDERVTSYVLQMPDGSAVRQPLAPGEMRLSIASTEAMGNYRVRAGGRRERLDRGFSVNLPAEVTQLERAAASQIVAALGEDRVRLARSREEIEVRVGLARTGRELFPGVIILVALVLAAEHWLANRFYQAPSVIGSRPQARSEAAGNIRPTAESPQSTVGAAR